MPDLKDALVGCVVPEASGNRADQLKIPLKSSAAGAGFHTLTLLTAFLLGSHKFMVNLHDAAAQ